MNDREFRRVDYPNVWLGVSVEDQETADQRILLLLKTPAAKRWVSAEPLLGEIDLSSWLAPKHLLPYGMKFMLDWLVAGGESGSHFRPMQLEWARSLKDQCDAAGVPCYFKQIAATRPGQPSGDPRLDAAKAVP